VAISPATDDKQLIQRVASAARPATPKTNVLRPEELRSQRMAQSFTSIVAVLMRDPGYKSLRIADLEWLVLPPVLSGQWRVAHARPQEANLESGRPGSVGNMMMPVAAALWASLSPNIDKRFSENLDKPLTLRPNEWLTGNIIWLMAVAGDRRYLPKFLKQLEETEFKGRSVKLRTIGPDGKTIVQVLGKS
jgi:cytolysin-activating lysine-acyltransferase